MHGPRLRLLIEGDGATRKELQEMAERTHDARPVMRVIQHLMLQGAREQFYSEGGHTGQPWQKDTAAWKQRKLEEGLNTRTERMTSSLMETLTSEYGVSVNEQRGSRTVSGEGIRRVSKKSTVFGTNLFYAQFQGKARRLLGVTMRDANRWTELMGDWILSGNTGAL